MKERGLRFHQGSHPISIGPGGAGGMMTAAEGCEEMNIRSAKYGGPSKLQSDTVVDEECMSRMGYFTASVEMLSELAAEER